MKLKPTYAEACRKPDSNIKNNGYILSQVIEIKFSTRHRQAGGRSCRLSAPACRRQGIQLVIKRISLNKLVCRVGGVSSQRQNTELPPATTCCVLRQRRKSARGRNDNSFLQMNRVTGATNYQNIF
jgi:hypothetical protein